MGDYSTDDLLMALDLAADHMKSISYTSPAARTVIVLAAAATHVPLAFAHLPRVILKGNYGSGKSTTLDAIQPLVQCPVRNSGQLSSTFAYKNDFRVVADENQGLVPTSMVDETKHIFGENGKRGSGHPLYAILTEGYSRTGAPIKYQENGVNRSYSCFQVTFTASKGMALPPDAVERGIVLELVKKPEGMKLNANTDPSVAANAEQVGAFLRAAVQAVYKPLKVTARDTDWWEAHGLDSRVADKWSPLFAIAKLAGGQWPALVAAAYAELGSKTSRNLPTALQLKVDVLSFVEQHGTDSDRMVARDLITYLMELGRSCYKWDDSPFTIKRFGMALQSAGVTAFKSNSTVYYRVATAWLKEADRIANPAKVELNDPENEWDALNELV
jgi:hypothetical protein